MKNTKKIETVETDKEMYKKNKKSLKRFVKSFGYAEEGIRYAFYHEQNIIVMFMLGIIAMIMGFILDISYTERLVIIMLIGIILPLELMNTAIEAVVNLHDQDKKSKYGKVAKDCASGAVAIASIFALIVGVIIFMPHIIELF